MAFPTKKTTILSFSHLPFWNKNSPYLQGEEGMWENVAGSPDQNSKDQKCGLYRLFFSLYLSFLNWKKVSITIP